MPRSERAPAFELAALVESDGRFRVHGELGRGASGVVFDVSVLRTLERLALKISHLPHVRGPVGAARWIVRGDSPPHPGLIRVLDAGLLGSHAYYTMERIEGRDLIRALRSRTDDRERQTLREAFVQLVRALGSLHAQGFVHRDVKPGNVLLCEDGRLVLLDLDIAVRCGDVSESSTVGTPAYMSPEQLSGGLLTPASDLYAVGVMLYEALSGRLPFADDATAKLERNPAHVSAHGVSVPDDLATLCHALLAQDPDRRPSAQRVLRALGVSDLRGELGVSLAGEEVWVGRARELELLRRAFTQARAKGAWVHVEGPPGRGKSQLVAHFLDGLRQQDPALEPLRARFETHARTPYAALDELVQELVRRAERLGARDLYDPCLEQLFPCTRRLPRSNDEAPRAAPLDPHEQREQAEHALRHIVTTLAAESPLVVWLDDLDRAPLDAVRVIQHWMRFPAPRGLLLITCSEAAPPSSVLGSETERLALAALSAAESEALARSVVRELSGASTPPISDISRASQGEPWAIMELCRAWVLSPAVGARSAERSLESRIDHLAPLPRQVLELACVAGRTTSFEELLLVARCAEHELASALGALSEAALVRFSTTTRSIAVDRTVERVVGAASSAEQTQAHHARWMLVSRARAESGELSCHLHARAAGEQDVAHDAGWGAAREARARLAFERAAELARAAAEARPDLAHDRELADLLALAGHNTEAAAAYARAAAQAGAAERMELSRLRARLLLREGDIHAALAAAHEVLEAVGLELPASTGRVIASLLWNKALLSLGRSRFRALPPNKIPEAELARVDALWAMGTLVATTDAVRGLELTTRCTRRALRCGDPQRAARALLNEALNDVVVERPPLSRARQRVREADEMVSGLRDPALHAYVRLGQGVLHFFAGEPADALEHLDAADAMFRTYTEHDLNQLTARHFGLQCLLMRAQVREARERTERFLAQAEARGDMHALTLLTAVGVVPTLLFTEDDPAGARKALEHAMRIWPRDQVYLQHLNELIAELMIHEYVREPGMLAAIDARLAQLSHAPLFRAPPVRAVIQCFRVYACLVEAAHTQADERERWLHTSRRELTRLMRLPVGFAQRRAVQLLPQLLLLEGKRDDAELAIERAREEFLRAGQDVTWTDYLLGRLEGGPAGAERARRARERMALSGYRNVDRALAASGADLL